MLGVPDHVMVTAGAPLLHLGDEERREGAANACFPAVTMVWDLQEMGCLVEFSARVLDCCASIPSPLTRRGGCICVVSVLLSNCCICCVMA
jgi:hypothetical protein